MINLWFQVAQLRSLFPLQSRVTVAWPGHPLDGVSGRVVGYSLSQEGTKVSVVVWSFLHGEVTHELAPRYLFSAS